MLENIINRYDNTKNLGIYSGRAGLSLISFLLAKKLDSQEYRKIGVTHFEYVLKNIFDVENLSFSDGLVGVGWFIEWIAQNNFVDINSDDVLEDVDDVIYKLATFHRNDSLDLNAGKTGLFLYLYQRLKAENPHKYPYRTLAMKECTLLLMNEIKMRVNTSPIDSLVETDLIQCLIITQNFKLLNIQPKLTDELLSDLESKLSTIKRYKLPERKASIPQTELIAGINEALEENGDYRHLKYIFAKI